jgi:serine/threonine-protein kinase
VFAQAHLTATGGVVGTAEYLSPEQAAGKPATKRSDLYSLGVVLYTLLTGRTPFEGTSLLELLHKHQYKQFDKPQRIVPDLPHDIDDIVCQLLEKDPAKRPPDCLVLGRQLERIRNKLERKSHPTEEGMPNAATVAENRGNIAPEDALPGPSTLMSRLVREELARQNQVGALGSLLNKGWVLGVLLVLCVGTIVWAFWPPGAESLFENGARLMASNRSADWERAWREYLQPLEDRFPDHPYQEEVGRFRAKRDAARDSDAAPSEAQRFYRQAERLREDGQWQAARKIYESVIVVFKNMDADKDWVRRSQDALQNLDQMIQARERWHAARKALARAQVLRDEGKRDQAEQIWSAIESLYRDDPAAREILAEIKKARTSSR